MNFDENFMDLLWWGVAPLAILYALYGLYDCRRTPQFPPGEKWLWALLIILFPIGGGVFWFRAKERRRAEQSPLMRRVRERRRGGR